MTNTGSSLRVLTLVAALFSPINGIFANRASAAEISTSDYSSIQAAVDANPGRVVIVPAGDHSIDATIRISGVGTSLIGSGRIVMSNPAKHILEIEHAQQI